MTSVVLTPRRPRPWSVIRGEPWLRAFAWSGGAGSLLTAIGAFGAGWLAPATDVDSWPALQSLRSQPATKVGAPIAVMAGVAILLVTWLLLGQRLHLHRITPQQLARLCLWWGTPLVLAPVLFSRDVFSYIAQSRLLPLGIDPYRHGAGVLPGYLGDGADLLWRNAPAPYGPAWMGLSSLVYRITGADAIPALLAFRTLAVAGVVLIAVFVPKLARACGADPTAAIWMTVLNPLLLMDLLSAAHNDALMLGLLVAGISVAMQGRLIPAMVLVSLAGAIKAPALIGIPFVVLAANKARPGRAGWVRACAVSGVVVVAVFTALNLVTGLGWGWLSNLGAPNKVRMWLTPTTAVGKMLSKSMSLVGLGDPVEPAISTLRTVGLVVTLAALAWLLVTGRRRTGARGLGLALIALAVLAPVMQPWYLLWGVVVLAGAGLRPLESRAAAVATSTLVLYSGVNVNALAATRLALKDGPAAAWSLGVVLVVLLAAFVRMRLATSRPGPRTTSGLGPRERGEPAVDVAADVQGGD